MKDARLFGGGRAEGGEFGADLLGVRGFYSFVDGEGLFDEEDGLRYVT